MKLNKFIVGFADLCETSETSSEYIISEKITFDCTDKPEIYLERKEDIILFTEELIEKSFKELTEKQYFYIGMYLNDELVEEIIYDLKVLENYHLLKNISESVKTTTTALLDNNTVEKYGNDNKTINITFN